LQEPPPVPPPGIRSTDEAPTEKSPDTFAINDLDISPAVARLLQNAAYEAHIARENAVDMEHVFLALVRQYEGTIGGILSILKLSPEQIREIIKNSSMNDPSAQGEPAAAETNTSTDTLSDDLPPAASDSPSDADNDDQL
jgi:ATP-dependent Clp protease ATP-binding subunit ClpA